MSDNSIKAENYFPQKKITITKRYWELFFRKQFMLCFREYFKNDIQAWKEIYVKKMNYKIKYNIHAL